MGDIITGDGCFFYLAYAHAHKHRHKTRCVNGLGVPWCRFMHERMTCSRQNVDCETHNNKRRDACIFFPGDIRILFCHRLSELLTFSRGDGKWGSTADSFMRAHTWTHARTQSLLIRKMAAWKRKRHVHTRTPALLCNHWCTCVHSNWKRGWVDCITLPLPHVTLL